MARLAGNPGLWRQFLYSYGFRVRAAHLEWLRHELTDAGWRGRMVLRHLVAMLPIALILGLALPGPLWLPLTVVLLFLVTSVGTVALYGDDMRVARLRRNGLEAPDDPDTGRPSHLPTALPVVDCWSLAAGRSLHVSGEVHEAASGLRDAT